MKKELKIYRVEHESDGLGMYTELRHGVAKRFPDYQRELRVAQSIYDHPEPDDDGISVRMMYGVYHFGFATISQMNQWVKNHWVREAMARDGYLLQVYSVNDANSLLHSNKQSMFVREDSKLIESFPLDHYDKLSKANAFTLDEEIEMFL